MQLKLGAGFVLVGLLYAVVDKTLPYFGLSPLYTTLLTISVYVAIVLGASWLLARTYARGLRDLLAATRVIQAGDLTHRLEINGRDETAELARAFDAMRENLLNIVVEVQDTAQNIRRSSHGLSDASLELRESSGEIAKTSDQIADGAKEQASHVLRTGETTGHLVRVAEEVATRSSRRASFRRRGRLPLERRRRRRTASRRVHFRSLRANPSSDRRRRWLSPHDL